MKTVCELNQCAGCMACKESCTHEAITIVDSLSAYNAVINEQKCVNCRLCYNVCPQNSVPALIEPKEWYQGWAKDPKVRHNSSSGGFAAAISKSFLQNGGFVYSCVFEDGKFIFKKAVQVSDIKSFTGSKYVKSNPSGVYKAIQKDLRAGQKVLFIGLPCQAAAVKNYMGKALQSNLYTMDLICHGTPSPNLLNIFLAQYGKSLNSFQSILFRKKGKKQIYGDENSIVTKGVCDRYTIAFLNGLTYTDNCYKCHFASRYRVSDITIGDSWGSELPHENQKDGISIALCQTEKGSRILKDSQVVLLKVNLEKAIQNNQQLEHPAIMPSKRNRFFEGIENGKNFNIQVGKYFPKQCIKQEIKNVLLYFRILK